MTQTHNQTETVDQSTVDVAYRERGILCRQPSLDVGTVGSESPTSVSHRFAIENTTDEPIPIAHVMTDCGCVTTEKPPREIPANSTVEIGVQVNVVGHPGPYRKSVEVRFGKGYGADEADFWKLRLDIRGTIATSGAIQFSPEKVDFGLIQEGETATRVVRLARYDASKIAYVKATCPVAGLSVTEVKPGDEKESFAHITLAFTSTGMKPGYCSSVVAVHTDHRDYPLVEIPVAAKIITRSEGFVESIFVDRLSAGSPQDKPLLVAETSTVDIQSVKYEGEGLIEATVVKSDQSAFPRVRITRTTGSNQGKLCRGELVLTLASADRTARIPVTILLAD